jgi:excisionase family DNA binding protein
VNYLIDTNVLLGPQPGSNATLTGPDGTRLELPGEIFEVLRDVVAALAQGLAITVAPHQTVLSTSEAASIVDISQPTFVWLLEAGEIQFSQPGRHRRVGLADLLAYQERGSGVGGVVMTASVRVRGTGNGASSRLNHKNSAGMPSTLAQCASR